MCTSSSEVLRTAELRSFSFRGEASFVVNSLKQKSGIYSEPCHISCNPGLFFRSSCRMFEICTCKYETNYFQALQDSKNYEIFLYFINNLINKNSVDYI